MTYQPPPSPPGGNPPPPPPPPPPGQWGPGAGGPRGSFDAKTVNALDWAIVGCGVIAFLFSFIDFYDGADITYLGHTVSVDGSASAWHDVIGGGFFGWFAMLFAVAGAVLVALELFAPQVKLPVANRLAALGLFAAAAVFEIIAIFVTPSYDYLTASADFGHGFGFWVSLLAVLAGTVLSLMRLQQTGGQLPGALGNLPNIGGSSNQPH